MSTRAGRLAEARAQQPAFRALMRAVVAQWRERGGAEDAVHRAIAGTGLEGELLGEPLRDFVADPFGVAGPEPRPALPPLAAAPPEAAGSPPPAPDALPSLTAAAAPEPAPRTPGRDLPPLTPREEPQA